MARDAARFTAVVVFPTPPFWLAIAMSLAIYLVKYLSADSYKYVSGITNCGGSWNIDPNALTAMEWGRVSRETGRVSRFWLGWVASLSARPDQRGVSRETGVGATTPLRELNEQILEIAG